MLRRRTSIAMERRACAITAVRDAASPAPDITDRPVAFLDADRPASAQGGKFGFEIRAALPAIPGGGHYLFTGSLADRGECTLSFPV